MPVEIRMTVDELGHLFIPAHVNQTIQLRVAEMLEDLSADPAHPGFPTQKALPVTVIRLEEPAVEPSRGKGFDEDLRRQISADKAVIDAAPGRGLNQIGRASCRE